MGDLRHTSVEGVAEKMGPGDVGSVRDGDVHAGAEGTPRRVEGFGREYI